LAYFLILRKGMDRGFEILERLLQATNIRQKVIASNITNADTPGYKAKDINFKGMLDEEITKLTVTHPNHIKTPNNEKGGEVIELETPSWGDNNNVELDSEVAKMTENAILYEAGIKLFSTKIRMFKNALRTR